jgi:hypothetical protein
MMDVKRAFVDLAKDRNGVAGIGTKHKGGLIRDWLLEREFGTRKYADCYRRIFQRGESSRASAEVVCDEFFAHFGWAGSHAVQTVVAPLKEFLSPKPPNTAIECEAVDGNGNDVCRPRSPLLSLLNPLKLVLNLFLKLQKHSFYLRDLIL